MERKLQHGAISRNGRGVFQDLAKERDFVFKVIGAPKYDLANVNVNAIPWQSATEVEDLSEMDIGIMPMHEDLWSQGKCGLKALQYMALGIPTICSPIGVNTKLYRTAKTGFSPPVKTNGSKN
jgi:glycosyltransferase involved in cell wall biosynthesis